MHPQENSHPQHDQRQPEQHHLPVSASDPTKSSKSLAIALVVSAVFLLAAAGIAAWLLLNKPADTSTVQNVPADDAAGVSNVSFVAPATVPVNYKKTDQSKAGATTIYYYDDATNCGITVGVSAVPTDKTVKAAVADALVAAETGGVTTASNTAGDNYSLKDADGKHTYSFASLILDQDVNVQGVGFTKQNNIILYKQFGQQIASLSYACKSDTWADKKAELAGLVKAFTVKTER